MAAKKKTSKAPTDKWAGEAALQALLKYGPQEQGLQQLQSDALDTYKSTVAQAQGSAQGAIAAVDQARPQVSAIYDPTLAKVAASQSLVGKDLAALGSGADAFKGGAATEAGTQIANIGAARTAALQDLATRRVAAASGGQFATENARQDLTRTLEKLFTAKTALDSEKGDYTALTAQQLHDAADKLANATAIAQGHDTTSRGNALIGAGIDPTTGAAIPGGKLDQPSKNAGKVSGTGVKLLGASKQASTADSIGQALDFLRTHKPKDIGDALSRLTQGQPAVPGKDGQVVYTSPGKAALNPDGTKKTVGGSPGVPAIPKFGSLVAQAATEMYTNGFVSDRTVKRLQDAGYRVRSLGITTRAQYAKAHKPTGGGLISSGIGAVQGASRSPLG